MDSKVGDLDSRLKRFSALMQETFEAAEGRARDIARVLAESSTEGTKAIANQYELVRATSDEERKRTSEALNSIYEQATGETSTMFRQVSERFIEIVRQMREMSAAMTREMETTRTELRKRHPGAAAGDRRKRRADAPRDRRADRCARRAQPHRRAAWPRHGRAGAPRRAGRGERRASRSTSARERLDARRSRWRRRAAIRRRAASKPQAPPAPGRPRRLALRPARPRRRATSRAQPAGDSRQTRQAMESLDSLSVDIARMIDHDAAAELWERYKRGERNVFTRRLYTLQGQKTFEEIRRRYRSDREFKQTVDRYIGEFERLLEEVSQGDRGQAQARTYLTSDTGKVYTMLAHAAGRFEGNG